MRQVRPISNQDLAVLLYSFYSEQADQNLIALEYLCWSTPAYSVFQGGVDRTVT